MRKKRCLRSDRYVTMGNCLVLLCERCCENTRGAEAGTIVALCPKCSHIMLFLQYVD